MGKRGRKPMAAEKRRLILDRLDEGWLQRETAAAAQVSIRTVKRVVAEARGMCDQFAVAASPPGLPARDCKTKFRLSVTEREEIRVGLAGGESMRHIARRLGRAPSTISRDLGLNGGRDTYRAVAAENRAATAAQRPKPRWWVTHPEQWEEVCDRLRQHWSPQMIAGRLRRDHPTEPERWVSAETIYQSIYVQGRGELRKELARCLHSGRAQRISRRPGEKARRGRPSKGW